ncbi:glycosyltransferase family 2 protein [Patescibacteria group bacterium]
MTFSVVIPTKNEEEFIGNLLESIKSQTLKPKEVIVADDSTDNTRKVARKYGAEVVQGVSDGRIGLGRNLGAKHVKEDFIVFLDADVKLDPDFFEKSFKYIKKHNLDIATCLMAPYGDEDISELVNLAYKVFNTIKLSTSKLPKAFVDNGACIIVKRKALEKVKGFNENMKFAEDVHLVNKVRKKGYKHKVMPYKIYISTRRFLGRDYKDLVRLLITVLKLGIALYAGREVYKKLDKKTSKRYFANKKD